MPVYVHPLEHLYPERNPSYPPPDPSVGGGLIALASLFPTRPVDVSGRLRLLPDDHSIPGMPGWCWLHTPGRAPRHTSLWREADSMLVVGDAFVTKNQSRCILLVAGTRNAWPPMDFTPDWDHAKRCMSWIRFRPRPSWTGHGRAMRSPDMRTALNELAQKFRQDRFSGLPAPLALRPAKGAGH